MALSKSIDVGADAPFSYIRVDTCEKCDQRSLKAVFQLFIYQSQASTSKANALSVPFGHLTFDGPAFNLYFTRALIRQAAKQGLGLHDLAYGALKDLLAATKAKQALMVYAAQQQVYAAALAAYNTANAAYQNAMKAVPLPNPLPTAPTPPTALGAPPPALTANQVILAEPGNAYASNNYGHILAFDGAADVLEAGQTG